MIGRSLSLGLPAAVVATVQFATDADRVARGRYWEARHTQAAIEYLKTIH
jgi:hypothetical protein